MIQIPQEYVYTFPEYSADLHFVREARKSRPPTLLVSFDDFVAQLFNERYGVNQFTTWRLGKFMLVNIYINHNKEAFDVGKLAVAGSYDILVSNVLSARVLDFAVKNDVGGIKDFPPPAYFLSDENPN